MMLYKRGKLKGTLNRVKARAGDILSLKLKTFKRFDNVPCCHIFVIFAFLFFAAAGFAEAGALVNWNYRKPVLVSNSTTSPLTDYQVLVTTDTASLISAGKMRSDCGDIRFTDSDGNTLLNYWIESGINTASTKIWVKVPSIPASSAKTIYMYYGNTGVTSVSDKGGTFTFWDDFTRANTSSGLGGSWTLTSGNWHIQTNKGVRVGTVNTPDNSQATVNSSTDFEIQFQYTLASDCEGMHVELGDISVWFGSWGYDVIQINSGGVQIGSVSNVFTTGTVYTLKIQAWGSNVKVFVNGTEKVSATTRTPSAGTLLKIGSWGGSAPGSEQIDDMQVRSFSSPEPTISVGAEASGDFSGTGVVSSAVSKDNIPMEKSMVRDSKGDLYLVYVKVYNGKQRIFLARSTDDGASWADTTAAPIETAGDVPSANSYDQSDPALAIDSNDVLHLVWGGKNSSLDTSGGVESKCVYSSAAVPGTSWSPYVKIPAHSYQGVEGGFSIGVDSKNGLHIVWTGQDCGNVCSSIRYSSRTATGSWTPYVEINNDGKIYSSMSLAIDSKDGVHIALRHAVASLAWATPVILYSSRSAAGSWGTLTSIFTDGNGADQGDPSLTIDSAGNLMAVWSSADTTYSKSQIKYTVRPPGGSWSTWAYAQIIPEAPQSNPKVAADALGNVYMVWSGSDTTNSVINIKRSIYNS
ncbi:MAG: DUF2341 domain-containing protein [Elusimicrobia bacterium]|nr:DUF2341 domain-containing protein [Elusimicrobiota bacterium]